MPNLQPVAFFSYAHADNKHVRGRLVELCERLRAELQFQTGQDFEIFLDHTNVGWGEVFRTRIETTLNASFYFIPVLTPRYFESEWCRLELDTFFRRERNLGRSDLVLPIYYQTCERLQNPASRARDPLATKIAARNWVDWRDLRHELLDTALMDRQVSRLADSLREALERTIAEQQTPPEQEASSPGEAPPEQEAAGASPPLVAPPEREAAGASPPGVAPPRRAPETPAPQARRPRTRLRVALAGVLAAAMGLTWFFLASPGRGGCQVATPDPSGQSLTVASRWIGQEQDSFELVLGAFSEQAGVDPVDYDVTGEDAESFIRQRVAAGNPPDVAFVSSPGLLKELAREGCLKPVDGIVADEVEANYDEFWQELGSGEDGELYGVWLKAANKSIVWYNTGIFETFGVEPPDTWTEMRALAIGMRDAGTAPFAVAGAEGWVLTDWFENIYLRTARADSYDQLSDHGISWTDPSVTRALRVFGEVADGWMAGGGTGARATDFESSVRQVFSDPPEAGMVYEGDFVAQSIPGDMRENAGSFPFPSIDGSARSVIVGGDVAVQLTDNPAAAEFMRYLATPEAAEEWAAQGGLVSPNENFDQSVYADEVSRRAAEQISTADVLRFDLSDLAPAEFGATPGEGMRGILQGFLTAPDDITGTQEALEQAARAAYD